MGRRERGSARSTAPARRFHCVANFLFLFLSHCFLRTRLETHSVPIPRGAGSGPLPCPRLECIRTLTFASWWVLSFCDSFCISWLALHRNGARSLYPIYLSVSIRSRGFLPYALSHGLPRSCSLGCWNPTACSQPGFASLTCPHYICMSSCSLA